MANIEVFKQTTDDTDNTDAAVVTHLGKFF